MLYARRDYVELIDGEEPFEEVGALPHGRRHDAAPAPSRRRPRRSRTSSPRSPPRGSPSAARRAPTTASPRPRWKTASARATSDDADRRLPTPRRPQAGASLLRARHRRLGRRRQVDADRPAALRHQGDLRGPARAVVEASARRARRRRRRPRAADRRPARRARAGHHDRRRLPLLRDAAAHVHHRRHARATCSTRATWSRAPRPPTSRSSSSTRATGSSEQSRRHAFIASLLRHPAPRASRVNKMDLVDWDEARLRRDRRRVHATSPRGSRSPTSTFIPISALHGDNVVERSSNMPWYDGPPLLYHLEHVHIASDRNLIDARFPVQWVDPPADRRAPRLPRLRRPGRRRRAAPGRRGVVLPCGAPSTRSRAIDTFDGDVDGGLPADVGDASASSDDLDVSRGDMICRPHNQPTVGARRSTRGLLDERARRCAPGAATRQAHDAHVRAVVERAPAPARRRHPAPRRRATSSASTTSAACAAHRRAADRRPYQRNRATGVVHPHRRGHERHRRRRA